MAMLGAVLLKEFTDSLSHDYLENIALPANNDQMVFRAGWFLMHYPAKFLRNLFLAILDFAWISDFQIFYIFYYSLPEVRFHEQ